MAFLGPPHQFIHLMENFQCDPEMLRNFSESVYDEHETLDSLQAGCNNFSLNTITHFWSNFSFVNTSLPQDEYTNPTYYSVNYRIIGTIFQSIIFVIGVLGNIMVVLVVKRSNSMQSPTNCYLVSLAIADCVVLWSAVPNEILAYFVLCDEWIWGKTGCALFIFMQYLGINASALSITAFTIERYIAICHPMKAQTVCTVHRAKRIIIGVWIFATIYCAPWLFLTKTVPMHYKGFTDKERCTFALDRNQYLGYFIADLIMFYVLPLLLSCVLYGLIARILVISNRLQPAFRNAGTAHSVNSKSNGFCNSNSKKTGSTARVQVVKMLVLVVVLFALLWMPYRVFVVYNSLASTKYMEPWFLMFSKTMIYMNSAINPILYNALSIKFRRAFRRMLLCGASDSQASSYCESERGMVTIRFRSTCPSSPVTVTRASNLVPPLASAVQPVGHSSRNSSPTVGLTL